MAPANAGLKVGQSGWNWGGAPPLCDTVAPGGTALADFWGMEIFTLSIFHPDSRQKPPSVQNYHRTAAPVPAPGDRQELSQAKLSQEGAQARSPHVFRALDWEHGLENWVCYCLAMRSVPPPPAPAPPSGPQFSLSVMGRDTDPPSAGLGDPGR